MFTSIISVWCIIQQLSSWELLRLYTCSRFWSSPAWLIWRIAAPAPLCCAFSPLFAASFLRDSFPHAPTEALRHFVFLGEVGVCVRGVGGVDWNQEAMSEERQKSKYLAEDWALSDITRGLLPEPFSEGCSHCYFTRKAGNQSSFQMKMYSLPLVLFWLIMFIWQEFFILIIWATLCWLPSGSWKHISIRYTQEAEKNRFQIHQITPNHSGRGRSHHASCTPAWFSTRRGTRTPPRNSSPNFRLLALYKSTLNAQRTVMSRGGGLVRRRPRASWLDGCLTSQPAYPRPLPPRQTAFSCSWGVASPTNGKETNATSYQLTKTYRKVAAKVCYSKLFISGNELYWTVEYLTWVFRPVRFIFTFKSLLSDSYIRKQQVFFCVLVNYYRT